MSNEKYNYQNLRTYLLGLLPKAETELFDELSFTGGDFAAALQSAENELVDAYISGELTGEILEKFENHYLASPLRREKVKFARDLQEFAAKEARKNEQAAGFFASINFFKSPGLFLQPGFAAAAAVLLFIVIGGFWIFNNLPNGRENQIVETDNSVQPGNRQSPVRIGNPQNKAEIAAVNQKPENLPANERTANQKEKSVVSDKTPASRKPLASPKISVAFFTFPPPVRGGSQLRTIAVPAGLVDAAFQLSLEGDDYSSYRAALTDQAGNNLWQSGILKTKLRGENNVLNLRFPAKFLKPQIYSIVVSGVKANGESEIIGNYSFRTVLK